MIENEQIRETKNLIKGFKIPRKLYICDGSSLAPVVD